MVQRGSDSGLDTGDTFVQYPRFSRNEPPPERARADPCDPVSYSGWPL